jgi:hypothetical protein
VAISLPQFVNLPMIALCVSVGALPFFAVFSGHFTFSVVIGFLALSEF